VSRMQDDEERKVMIEGNSSFGRYKYKTGAKGQQQLSTTKELKEGWKQK